LFCFVFLIFFFKSVCIACAIVFVAIYIWRESSSLPLNLSNGRHSNLIPLRTCRFEKWASKTTMWSSLLGKVHLGRYTRGGESTRDRYFFYIISIFAKIIEILSVLIIFVTGISDCCNEVHYEAWEKWEGHSESKARNWGNRTISSDFFLNSFYFLVCARAQWRAYLVVHLRSVWVCDFKKYDFKIVIWKRDFKNVVKCLVK